MNNFEIKMKILRANEFGRICGHENTYFFWISSLKTGQGVAFRK
jgi:hypothetical protein